MDTAKETSHKASEPAVTGQKGPGKRKTAGVILFCLVLAALFFGGRLWLHSQSRIETDNAFIESHVHSVAAKVSGTVSSVRIRDNQFVRKGELLLTIDPTDYRVRAKEAAAALAVAANETSGDYARIESAKAEVSQSRAKLLQAEADLQRGKGLFAKEVIPREQLERLATAKEVVAAQVREKEEQVRRLQAEIGLAANGGKEAKIAQKQAQLEETNLNISYTQVFAPADGYVTRKGVEAGNYVQPGQPLLAVVPLQDAWVTANYKEGQLTHVKPGQPVEFTVDSYPGRKFRGAVESVMAGTGAAFSLLPPENATGNYVKVVQRIPVKITVDQQSDPGHLLRVGMSVVPTIMTGRTAGEIIRELFRLR
ncbi:MAG TPA: HlyD family secretion protein [Geobacteraceae bacterium]